MAEDISSQPINLILKRNQILQVSDFSLKKFKFKKLSCIMVKVKEDT
ncbi:hypothetical protein IGL98_000802 [Enterococcus sp. DIV0840]